MIADNVALPDPFKDEAGIIISAAADRKINYTKSIEYEITEDNITNYPELNKTFSGIILQENVLFFDQMWNALQFLSDVFSKGGGRCDIRSEDSPQICRTLHELEEEIMVINRYINSDFHLKYRIDIIKERYTIKIIHAWTELKTYLQNLIAETEGKRSSREYTTGMAKIGAKMNKSINPLSIVEDEIMEATGQQGGKNQNGIRASGD